MTRTRAILSILSIVFACFIYANLRVPDASAQGAEDDIISPSLLVREGIDFGVLREFLDHSTTRSFVYSGLSAGKLCQHLGSKMTWESNGDRDYSLVVGMRDLGEIHDLLRGQYQYRSAGDPQIPPDSVQFSTDSSNAVYSLVVFSDAVGYDFLLTVLNDPPSAVVGLLSTHDLVQLYVERGGSPEIVRLYLKYETPSTSKTLIAWAEHYGGSNFGPVSVIEG